MVNPRLIVAYILLVGLPLGALTTILRAGRQLTAPISMGGAWHLNADFHPMASTACGDFLAGIGQPFFKISQSGEALVFVFNDSEKPEIAGRIHATSVTMGSGALEDGTPPCTDAHALYLKAGIRKQGEERFLTGLLGINNCAKCPSIPFTAIREPTPDGEAK
jgi:hypothetical protein